MTLFNEILVMLLDILVIYRCETRCISPLIFRGILVINLLYCDDSLILRNQELMIVYCKRMSIIW